MNNSAKSLVQDFPEIGSLPSVFSRINDAVNDPKTSVSQVAHIVSEDPGVSSRLLRIANSAFYGLPKKVDTISQAVVVLGTHQVRDLVLATSVINLFQGIPEDFVSMESFWKHSIACAMFCRALATQRRQANVERFFVAGMLHDVGRLILFRNAQEPTLTAFQLANTEQLLLAHAERRTLGFDHSDLGVEVLEMWKLPPSLTEPVAYHHSPSSARQYPLETAIVHIADILTNSLEVGTSGSQRVPPLSKKAWTQVELSADVLAPIVTTVEREIDEVVSALIH